MMSRYPEEAFNYILHPPEEDQEGGEGEAARNEVLLYRVTLLIFKLDNHL